MLSVRLDKKMEEELNLLSAKKRVSKSQIIKDSLLEYFEKIKQEPKEKTPYELGSDLFGRHGSGDSDRSTTYKKKIRAMIDAKNSR